MFCSLVENEWSKKLATEMNDSHWECPNCGTTGLLSPVQKLQHTSTCLKQEKKEESSQTSTDFIRKSNSRAYDCPECNKTLYLAPIEILKHKKQHQ